MKIEVLPLVVYCCLPPLLPEVATVAAAAASAAAAPVSVAGSFTTSATASACRSPLVCLGPAPIAIGTVAGSPPLPEGVRRGQRRRHAELVDDAGDIAAAAIARDLVMGAAIPAGGEGGGGGGGGGGGSAGPSGWLSRRLTSHHRRLLSSWRSTTFCPMIVCLLHASPHVCLLFASWLLHHPCCYAAAISASRLCLDLFFPIWLSQLATPHLMHRRRLSSSSRLCLVTCHLRLSMCCSLTTGCVVTITDAQTSLPSMRRRLRRHHDCDCRPRRLSPSFPLSSWCCCHHHCCC